MAAEVASKRRDSPATLTEFLRVANHTGIAHNSASGRRRPSFTLADQAMERIDINGWIIEFDRNATIDVYAAYRDSFAPCTCDNCRNFRVVRDGRLPIALIDFATLVGIDLSFEGETYQTHRRADGLHGYGGWFHFIGRLVSAPPELIQREEGISFEATPVPLPPAFPRDSTFHVSFHCYLPWLLDAPEPQ